MYTVIVSDPNKLEKQIRKYPIEIKVKLFQVVDSLVKFPDVTNLKKLKGDGYRIRINNYRLLFDVDSLSKEIIIQDFLHRKEAYR